MRTRTRAAAATLSTVMCARRASATRAVSDRSTATAAEMESTIMHGVGEKRCELIFFFFKQ
jgi:hypothetical protein